MKRILLPADRGSIAINIERIAAYYPDDARNLQYSYLLLDNTLIYHIGLSFDELDKQINAIQRGEMTQSFIPFGAGGEK